MILALLALIGGPRSQRPPSPGTGSRDPLVLGGRRLLLLLPGIALTARSRPRRFRPIRQLSCAPLYFSPASSSPTTSCRAGSSIAPTSSRIRHFFLAFFDAYGPPAALVIDTGTTF